MNEINIVGAGLAGLSAAITAAKQGRVCRLISLQPSERAQSVMAEGGVNAALDTMGEGDSPQAHFLDTCEGGVGLADPNAVRGLTAHAPAVVRTLCARGVPFHTRGGALVLRPFGGQKKRRTAYAKSSTGKALMTALIDEARKYEAQGLILRYAHHEFVSLALNKAGDACLGVYALDRYTGETEAFAGAVILASGGMNGLFPGLTTGSAANTGDVTATVFAQGVALANLEFIQYHPTTVGIPGKRCLISEAARGEGGRLYALRDGEPRYFMEELYPELGNLMPRDVVSREMTRALRAPDGDGQVYLDMTGIDASVWAERLSDLREECVRLLAKDPQREPIAVAPGIHYFMGGIDVDERHRTSLRGLFAAGECACQYHGANRLGGNSMLGAIYGGAVAATAAVALPAQAEEPAAFAGTAVSSFCEPTDRRIADILAAALGVFRDGDQLQTAADKLAALDGQVTGADRNRLLLARAMTACALARRESRGAHTRLDYPARNDADYRKTTVATFDGETIRIAFRDIPPLREDEA